MSIAGGLVPVAVAAISRSVQYVTNVWTECNRLLACAYDVLIEPVKSTANRMLNACGKRTENNVEPFLCLWKCRTIFIYYLSVERWACALPSLTRQIFRTAQCRTETKKIAKAQSEQREWAAECLAGSRSGNNCSIGQRTINQNVKPASMAVLYTNSEHWVHLCDVQHSSSSSRG